MFDFAVEYVPAAQLLHVPALTLEKVPGTQFAHVPEVAVEYVPALQLTHVEAADDEYVPAIQLLQVADLLEEKLPGLQLEQADDEDWPVFGLYVPDWQGLQLAGACAPDWADQVPALQLMHVKVEVAWTLVE